MKEFIEKLIGRLEKLGWVYADYYPDETAIHKQRKKSVAYDEVVKIVNQLAEEYKQDITFQYVLLQADILKRMGIDISSKWETATQQASALNEAYMRGRQDERDRFTEWQNENNGGWIPCSKRLPENNDAVNITWVNRKPEPYYEGVKDKPFTATGHYHKGKWYWFSCVCKDYLDEYGDSEFDRVDKDIEVIAWQPLPESYTPKQEEQKG